MASLYCQLLPILLLAAAEMVSGQCVSCAAKQPRFFDSGKSQYAFVECPLVSWSDARKFCRQIFGPKGDLLVVDTSKERKLIRDTLNLLYGDDQFGWWIGLNHRKAGAEDWHWLDRHSDTPERFFWAPGQPNGNTVVNGRRIANSPCVELIDNQNWNDYDCSFPLRFICEGPSSNDDVPTLFESGSSEPRGAFSFAASQSSTGNEPPVFIDNSPFPFFGNRRPGFLIPQVFGPVPVSFGAGGFNSIFDKKPVFDIKPAEDK